MEVIIMRLFRFVFHRHTRQTRNVLIDMGDRCAYIDPTISPADQEAAKQWAVDQLNRVRRRRAGAAVKAWVEYPV